MATRLHVETLVFIGELKAKALRINLLKVETELFERGDVIELNLYAVKSSI